MVKRLIGYLEKDDPVQALEDWRQHKRNAAAQSKTRTGSGPDPVKTIKTLFSKLESDQQRSVLQELQEAA
ncbi:MAG: hypothetical protein AAF950_17780 [Pseudomonadota bacterium]